jgi:hypothetical protein
VGGHPLNDRLDTEVDYLLSSDSANSMFIWEANDITLYDNVAENGAFDLIAGGSIFGLHNLNWARFDIYAHTYIYLGAGGTIGRPDNPVWFMVPHYAPVYVAANGAYQELSIYMKSGTTHYNYVHEPYDRFHIVNTPPGLVLYNNRLMGGGNVTNIKNRGYQGIVSEELMDFLYPYSSRWSNSWYYDMLTRKYLEAQDELLSDERVYGPNVLLDLDDIGYKVERKGKRLIIQDKGAEIQDLGIVYPYSVPLYAPFSFGLRRIVE